MRQILESVKELEKEGKKVRRFSITGYSLGGLIARYVVGYVSCDAFVVIDRCSLTATVAFWRSEDSSKMWTLSISTPSRRPT